MKKGIHRLLSACLLSASALLMSAAMLTGCGRKNSVPDPAQQTVSVPIVDVTTVTEAESTAPPPQTTEAQTETTASFAETSKTTEARTQTTASEISSESTKQTASTTKSTESTKQTASTTKSTESTKQTASTTKTTASTTAKSTTTTKTRTLDKNGSYDTKDDVALYIHQYGRLPSNFITKKEAQALGWTGGSLEPYAPGKSIGGSYFGNYEGILPEKQGRKYTECDIGTTGKSSRGAKRIVFSNDGLIYYTDDHYKTFQLLYGEE